MSLHKDTEKPEHGFGYPEQMRAEVEARRDRWNSYTVENCEHKAMLGNAKCGLCGFHYIITDLL
jgi:hypothetical protein